MPYSPVANPRPARKGRSQPRGTTTYDFTQLPEGLRIPEGTAYAFGGLQIDALAGDTAAVPGPRLTRELQTSPRADNGAFSVGFRLAEKPTAVVLEFWLPSNAPVQFFLYSDFDGGKAEGGTLFLHGGQNLLTKSLSDQGPIEALSLGAEAIFIPEFRCYNLVLFNQ